MFADNAAAKASLNGESVQPRTEVAAFSNWIVEETRQLSSPLTKSSSADFVLSSTHGGESAMAMGRSDAVQEDLMATWAEMPRSPGHAFYDRLRDLLREAGFDAFVEGVCKPYYAPRMGAPSLPPGRYFRMHMIGYFEGIDSERGHRVALRGFVLAARFPAAVEPGESSRRPCHANLRWPCAIWRSRFGLQAAVAARHVRNASSRRTLSVRRDVKWRWTLKVFWTAA